MRWEHEVGGYRDPIMGRYVPDLTTIDPRFERIMARENKLTKHEARYKARAIREMEREEDELRF